jgi:hypothetical protein
MAGARGKAYRRRTGVFAADESVRAAAVLQPGEDAHRAYRELINEMGVSGAEVVRQALLALHQQRHTANVTKEAAA